MHRTGVRVRWGRLGSLVAIAATAVALAGAPGTASPSIEPAGHRTYTVRSGDTVWSIARRIAGPQADPRPFVERIVTLNDVDPGALQPGQTLELPSR